MPEESLVAQFDELSLLSKFLIFLNLQKRTETDSCEDDGTKSKKKRKGLLLGLLKVGSSWYTKFMEAYDSECDSFQKNTTPQDLRELKLARVVFHSCSILPALVYYLGAVENPVKFPATISFTIRKGLPKKIHFLLWSVGWAIMGRVIRRSGSKFFQRFVAQMYVTGVWTTSIFPIGKSHAGNIAHFLGASAYMIDHIAFFKLLNMKPIFRKAFYVSFVALSISIAGTGVLEKVTGIANESDSNITTADRARQMKSVSPRIRRSLFLSELVIMLAENLLFASFVHGLPSGINIMDIDDDKNDDKNEEKKKKMMCSKKDKDFESSNDQTQTKEV